MSVFTEKLNFQSSARYIKSSGNVEMEIYLSELIEVMKFGSKFSKHRLLIIFNPILNKALVELQNSTQEKNIKLKININLKTLVITITCISALGVLTYCYGIVPAVGTALTAAAIFQITKILQRSYPVTETEFLNIPQLEA